MNNENDPSSEALLAQITEIGELALEAAYKVHQELGARGLDSVQKSQYGETALRVDIEVEEAVIQTLMKNKLPLILNSEEHGLIQIGDNPQFYAILDGLDGTAVYKKERGVGRYGTMLGIYGSTNPKYDDYLFGGIMEHASHRLYFAGKGKGCWKQENGLPPQILRCADLHQLDSRTCRFHIDIPFDHIFGGDMMKKIVSKVQHFPITVLESSAINYADLIEGKVEVVIEGTRKGNLEIAVAYPLVKEAGGVMVTSDGKSLGSKSYLDYGQKEHIPIISVCTLPLAQELVSFLRPLIGDQWEGKFQNRPCKQARVL